VDFPIKNGDFPGLPVLLKATFSIPEKRPSGSKCRVHLSIGLHKGWARSPNGPSGAGFFVFFAQLFLVWNQFCSGSPNFGMFLSSRCFTSPNCWTKNIRFLLD
jgi:hypothetical protein